MLGGDDECDIAHQVTCTNDHILTRQKIFSSNLERGRCAVRYVTLATLDIKLICFSFKL